jgi:hypothetical protein
MTAVPLFGGFPRPYTLADAQAWRDPATRPESSGRCGKVPSRPGV